MDLVCPSCREPFFWSRTPGWQRKYCSVPCRSRAKNMRSKFGLSMQDFWAMFDAQGGVCKMPLCLNPLVRGQGGTHVDHCHSTGLVRGLLCRDCNISLGHYEYARRLGAAEYLKGGEATNMELACA